MRILKEQIRHALQENVLQEIPALVRQDHKGMSLLIRFSYDKTTLVGWRAIVAAGLVARDLVRGEPDFLRETCRKLFWSLNDESGGIGWSSPELLGEIVSSDTDRFADLVPIVAGCFEIEGGAFRAGSLYAVGRIADTDAVRAAGFPDLVLQGFVDKDPMVRYRAVELAGKVGRTAVRTGKWTVAQTEKIVSGISDLRSDMGESWIYRRDDFVSQLVCEEARRITIY